MGSITASTLLEGTSVYRPYCSCRTRIVSQHYRVYRNAGTLPTLTILIRTWRFSLFKYESLSGWLLIADKICWNQLDAYERRNSGAVHNSIYAPKSSEAGAMYVEVYNVLNDTRDIGYRNYTLLPHGGKLKKIKAWILHTISYMNRPENRIVTKRHIGRITVINVYLPQE